jgi:hypothetical protein
MENTGFAETKTEELTGKTADGLTPEGAKPSTFFAI